MIPQTILGAVNRKWNQIDRFDKPLNGKDYS
jgi:hypothetical protein